MHIVVVALPLVAFVVVTVAFISESPKTGGGPTCAHIYRFAHIQYSCSSRREGDFGGFVVVLPTYSLYKPTRCE